MIHKLLLNFFCALLFSFFSIATFAQADTIKKAAPENAEILEDYNQKLQKIEAQAKEDSIKKAALELQLLQLKTTDNLKKDALQKQLEELSNKEVLRLADKKARIDLIRATAKHYPVMGFFNDTLFNIYSRLGSFSPLDRANAITERVNKLADQFNFSADTLKVSEAETTFDIVYNESIILSVSENDALWNNTTKAELAKKYRKIIADAVVTYQAETSLINLAKEIGLALLVLLVFFLIIRYCNKLFKWTLIKIKQQEGKKIKGIKIKNYTLLDSKNLVEALTVVNTIVKWIVIIFLIYIALPILFGIFPWTRGFAETLISYFVDPFKNILRGIWNYMPNLFTIVVIVIVFKYILKGIYFLKSEIERGALTIPGFYSDWANPSFQIIRVLLFAFMLVVIFPYMPGSDSQIFKGVSVFIGVLFTFGSAGALSNVVSGLVLTYMRAFKIGDRIKIGEVTGDIIEKSLLVTRVKTIKNEIISIPNSNVMSSHTINYSSEANNTGLIMHTTVTIGYDVPWKKMHQVLLDAASRTDMLLQEPKPFVLQTSLDDFYVSYQVNAYTRHSNKQAVIYSQLHQNIQDCCNEAGVEILSPHYRAARDGNSTTIPTDYLDKDYKAPGFNVNMNNTNK